MHDAWAAFFSALVLVFLAEFADKTQLVVLGLAAKGRALRVWAGAVLAFLLLVVIAVTIGETASRFLPDLAIHLGAGLLFLLFGALLLRRRDAAEAKEVAGAPAFWRAFAFVFVAEMGDKSMIALVVLAAGTGHPVASGLGGFTALTLSALLAALLGNWAANRFGTRRIQVAAAWLFLALGVVFIISAFLPIPLLE